MKRIMLLLAVTFSALAILPAVAQASYLGPPWTTNDGTFQAAQQWYPRCGPALLEYRKVDSNPAPYGKWRQTFDVCKNEIEACGYQYYWWLSDTGRWYAIWCGHAPRNFDAWCSNGNGNIRVRDLYHGWEMVTGVPCVKWY